jgi:hypothetical protein
VSSRRRQPPKTGVKPADWDFFAFPTFFGFSFGMFLATILIIIGLIDIVYLASLMALAFSLAHLTTRAIARYRQEKRKEREEEEERERRALAARARAAAEEPDTQRRRRRRRRA